MDDAELLDDGTLRLGVGQSQPIDSIQINRWALARDLRHKRHRQGLSQKELAIILGCSDAQISNMERFVGAQPSLENFFRVIIYLKKDPYEYIIIKYGDRGHCNNNEPIR